MENTGVRTAPVMALTHRPPPPSLNPRLRLGQEERLGDPKYHLHCSDDVQAAPEAGRHEFM